MTANTTKTYNHTFDAHLTEWLKAAFNLTVEAGPYAGYMCFVGDYDYDVAVAYGRTRFGAASDYAAGYDGALSDRLDAIELGA